MTKGQAGVLAKAACDADWEVRATTGDWTAADQLSLRTFWALTVDPSHRKSATMLIVGQQAHGERMRKDDVPRTDLADQ